MPFALLKYGLRNGHIPQGDIPPTPDLKRSYDVVIIGAGGHGLAAAYYLSNAHGIRNVAVLDKGYLAGGNTARNTTTVRSNYLTTDSIAFYKEGVSLFETMSNDLGFNIMFSQRGQLTLAHSDGAMRSFRLRAETGKHMKTRIEVVDAATVREICPLVNMDEGGAHEVLGGLWHEDGGTARHDAVAWGYARRAAEKGVEIHQRTEVTGMTVRGDRVTEVQTNRGTVVAGQVLQAAGGLNGHIAGLAGIALPIRCFPLQAMVTQPLKPFLDILLSSSDLHTYFVQSSRGELVIGGGTDPYQLASTRSSLPQKEALATGAMRLLPFLHNVKVMRQWAGITDITPDFSPVMGASPLVNYWLDAGWGTWGFKATPVAGKRMAETVATGRVPDLLKPFAMDRFDRFALLNEMGATAAGH